VKGVAADPTPAGPAGTWNARARFLAGLPQESQSALSGLEQGEGWREHSRRCAAAWAALEKRQLRPISEWVAKEIRSSDAGHHSLFYPFSGPDIVYARAFFPDAADYILIGLEPVGSTPPFEGFSATEAASYLSSLRVWLDDVLSLSFFKTEDMKRDVEAGRIDGVLPSLLFLLARDGCAVSEVDRPRVDKSGATVEPTQPGTAPPEDRRLGVLRIRFRGPAGDARTLYYFRFDLSNGSLQARPSFTAFLKRRQPLIGFVKAPSYLMYRPAYSGIRELILDSVQHLLQDDSGIPLQYFDRSLWRLHFYGTYQHPIPLFTDRLQLDLKEVYDKSKEIKPLTFGFGYQVTAAKSNLMWAVKTAGPPVSR
jgi:hypothetical protein